MELPVESNPITMNNQFSVRLTKIRLKKAMIKQISIMGLWLIVVQIRGCENQEMNLRKFFQK